MTRFERRWAVAALEGFAGDGDLAKGETGVDYGKTFDAMRAAGNAFAAFGLRLAVWMVALAPLWRLGRPRLFGSLSLEARASLLDKLQHSRAYLVRELTTLLKIVASMALLGSSVVRDRSHYDRLPAASGVTP